ncbi:hypothetical protein [Vibrio campbellii]|uniref:hypothetical protein n=1 Tax=Vibrio campbellii TaxID=680 RepID=UPI00210886FB|nr:hypothetical protein [Vibrio campbellii]UTZ44601.1 hypothetical protein HB764_25415 [Vibrio campbellii]
MQIPAFPLPSNLTKIIHFRVPNVEDGMEFCELNPDYEEANTTQYLNHLQDKEKGEFSDSSYWTGEDRRTALWWIFIASSELGTIPFSYECAHCKEKHFADLDMRSLMDTSTVLSKLPELTIKFTVRGQPYSANVSPLTGEALEYIEQLRNIRDQYEEDSKEWKQAANNMALNELAMTLTFPTQPKDKNEALEWKLNTIKSMHLRTEFLKLSALVEQELRTARHGLLCEYNDGRYHLVSQISQCKKVVEKGGEAVRTLLLPFRADDFIATF